MSQKTTRKTRRGHTDESSVEETEKTPELGSESEPQENGTKENQETVIEPNELNSKESSLTETKENGTEVPNESEKDNNETEDEQKGETIEENVEVLPETEVEPTQVLNPSDTEEQVDLDLQVEQSAEEISTKTSENEELKSKENENGDTTEEYQQAEDTVNGKEVDVCTNGEAEYENSGDDKNVSTQVNIGNDTTRNIDFTFPATDCSIERSKFLDMSRDHSVGESIKYLSSRRSIRSVKSHYVTDGVNSYTLPKSENARHKRKNCDDAGETVKRIKTDSSSLFSYLSNPFGKNDMLSSTPKLTGFKSNNFDNTNVSKISLNDTEKSQNKWCSVM